MGRVVFGQHEYQSVDDKPGALERQLAAYRRDGRKVVSYWRARRSWCFKLMALR